LFFDIIFPRKGTVPHTEFFFGLALGKKQRWVREEKGPQISRLYMYKREKVVVDDAESSTW
jgi:hypothetical protein